MLSIEANNPVEISVNDASIVIIPVKKKHLTLAEHFASYDDEMKKEEYWIGDPKGKEVF